MANRQPMEIGEWYHCYNRGVDKRRVFLDKSDYARFLLLLYTANDSSPARIFNLGGKQLAEVATSSRIRSPLVELGAYSLMPNHFHFVIKEIKEGGIALFMQKVFTGYTMYFNKKRERTGALFAGSFKSKHVANDDYLKQLVPYVHLNCAELFDPRWKMGKSSARAIEERLQEYPYSSLPDFLGITRAERAILGSSIFELFDFPIEPRAMLDDAKRYYESINKSSKV